jgi:NAD(P)-dependent dehydrogenase (short-subunit alcohol dehydrogenase family)
MIGTDMIRTCRRKKLNKIDAVPPFIAPLNHKGSPPHIANLALFLASDDSSFITGQIIFCDGGMKL